MTDKTKRIILIAAGVLLCAALVVGIVSRLAAVPMPIDPAIPDDTPNTKDPVVNISDPEVKVDSRTDGKQHNPGRDADSSGTEQTIQGAATKPDAPEHPGKTEKDHAADVVPEADRNKETPPTYKPEQTEEKPQPTEPAGGSTMMPDRYMSPASATSRPAVPTQSSMGRTSMRTATRSVSWAAKPAFPERHG